MNRILQNRNSVEELRKWNLLEQVEDIRIAEDARSDSVESAQNQLQVRPTSISGRLAVDSENHWSTFLVSGRMMSSTIVVAVLCVRSVFRIMETYVNGKGRIDLNIFSRIAVMDLPSAAQDTLSPLKANQLFNTLSESVCGLLLKFREMLHQIHEFLSDYGLGDFEYPSYLPNVRLSEWKLLKAHLDWQRSVSTLWITQIMTLGFLTLGPLLLWHRAVLSSSKAVCAAGDVVTVGEALNDLHFKAAFPLLFLRCVVYSLFPVSVLCPTHPFYAFCSISGVSCASSLSTASP